MEQFIDEYYKLEKSIRDERRVAQAFQAAAELDLKHYAEDAQKGEKPVIAHVATTSATGATSSADAKVTVDEIAPVVTVAEQASLNDFLGKEVLVRVNIVALSILNDRLLSGCRNNNRCRNR